MQVWSEDVPEEFAPVLEPEDSRVDSPVDLRLESGEVTKSEVDLPSELSMLAIKVLFLIFFCF